MIYTRFGDKVELIAIAGIHEVADSFITLALAQVTHGEDEQKSTREKYVSLESLKAEGGYWELEKNVAILMLNGKTVALKGKKLNAAIQEAS